MEKKEQIQKAQIDLIKELGIDQLSGENQEKALLSVGEVIQQKVLTRIIEDFPDEKRKEFLEKLENSQTNPAEIQKIIEENIPNYEDLILEEIESYKKELVGFMKKAKGESPESDTKNEESPQGETKEDQE